ncbi:ABC transporter permease [Roseomonas xinghualingensis]|uniref:ABC transporter permease n=1 Tax=Roseomonas xinghualingensis TaxID=2986475 RepID=UPI0021F0C71A|nr:ABC transporter permease [Roseomonas sp. SXEYE001]MCV4207661.1 ABC transporter permease [Roseomonas sp. SXEYE001]
MKKAALWLALGAVAFLAALWAAPQAEGLWSALFPEVSRPAYVQESWFVLLGSHLALSLGAALLAAMLGIPAGIAATRSSGRALRPVVDAAFTLAQSVPPVAVIALALPLLGFGAAPTLLALVLYGALPLLRATVTGIESVPAQITEAARGLGLSPWQRLTRVELPLARPVLLAGLRVAVTLSVATTAVGAVAGARCLGTPIIIGLTNANPSYVLQGALFTAWLALLLDRALSLLAGPQSSP